MSQKLPEMLQNTIQRVKEMVDSNSVVGDPIVTQDGVTIIPVSRIDVGLAGGGSDFAKSKCSSTELPFGGGVGAGVKVTPVCFLVVKDGSVRMLPIAQAANTTVDRVVDMIPDTLDKITDFIDSRSEKKANK